MLISAQTGSPNIFTGSSGLLSWRALTKNLGQRLDRFAQEPVIAREIAYFKEQIGAIADAEGLVADRRLYEFALSAYDLEGQENSQALLRKVLSEDLDDRASTANRMTDPRFRAMAVDFAFAPGAGTADRKLLDRTVTNYVRTIYEQRTGVALPDVTTPTQDDALAAIAAEPAIAAEIEYYRSIAPTLSTPAEIVSDPRLVAFAYRAAGFAGATYLDDEFLTRVIGDTEVAADLGDERWSNFADAFAWTRDGRTIQASLIDSRIDAIAERWVKASFTLETGRQINGTMPDQLKADLAAYALRPDIKARIETFKGEIGEAEGSLDLIADADTYAFVMRAFDLEQFGGNGDLVLRTLSLPADSRTSPAAQDSRFKDLAQGLDFLGKESLPSIRDPAFVDRVVDRYIRVQFERAVGGVDLPMRQALYAQRQLPKVTSPYQILGDVALREVVLQAVGLPNTASQDVERLAKVVGKRVELDQLKDPEYLDRLINRYFGRAALGSTGDVAASTSGSAYAVNLLANSGSLQDFGIGIDLLLQVQSGR